MPKLTKIELTRRAQRLKKLYIKHEGNKSRIAKELGVTPPAVDKRFNNAVGQEVQRTLEDEVKIVAKKLGISLTWYIKKLKEGSIKPKYKRTVDYAVRHKYLVTLGEVLKYVKQVGTTVDNSRHVHLTVEKRKEKIANLRKAITAGLI